MPDHRFPSAAQRPTRLALPFAAIAVLLPVYLYQLGFDELKSLWALKIVLVYTLFISFMMVSSIPTYSGKLLGERVGREWVLPIFVLAIGLVAMLFTYPYETLTALTLVYLACIPLSWRNYRDKIEETAGAASAPVNAAPAPATEPTWATSSATLPVIGPQLRSEFR